MAPDATPVALLRHARAQAGLVSHRQLRAAGVPRSRMSAMVARGRWLRVVLGVYDVMPAHGWADPYTHNRLRAAWTGLLSADPQGIATGACALALHGAWGLPRQLTPEVALPEGRSSSGVAGVRLRRFSKPMNFIRHQGRLIVDPATALVQALPEWPRDVAVTVLDSALNRRLISAEGLERIKDQVRGRRGAARLQAWWPLIEPSAQSPLETLARLQCFDAGLPPPILQARVVEPSRRIIARGELGWRRSDGTWLLVESDGKAIHDRPDAVLYDRFRQYEIALAGRHTLLRFTAEDIHEHRIASTIIRALRMTRADRT